MPQPEPQKPETTEPQQDLTATEESQGTPVQTTQ